MKWVTRVLSATPLEAGLAASALAGWVIAIGAGIAMRVPSLNAWNAVLYAIVPYAVAVLALRAKRAGWKVLGIVALAGPTYVSWQSMSGIGWLSGFGATIALDALIAVVALVGIARGRRFGAHRPHVAGA